MEGNYVLLFLFFNQKSIFDYLDYYDNESRTKEKILFSYTYPLCESIEYNKLKSIADNIVKELGICYIIKDSKC